MNMNLQDLSLAMYELYDIAPDIRITKILPAYDGICFYRKDGYTYKYEYASGCVSRIKPDSWRKVK